MDMSNVKAIFDNNMQKNVKKITDENGNVLWRKNLFDGFDSPWLIPRGVYSDNGKFGAEAEGRALYFFRVKPNTTYRYIAEVPGDRMFIFALSNSHDTPPVPEAEKTPYNERVRIVKKIYTTEDLSSYTFTTSSTDRMVYMCIAREVRPTGVKIVELN